MRKIHLIAVLGLFFAAQTASALYFRLDGDRLWLQAEQTPLVDVLEQFSRVGVGVRLDPSIQSTVTGAVRGAWVRSRQMRPPSESVVRPSTTPTQRPAVENDRAAIGEAVAIENARKEMWALMGYELQSKLAGNR